MYEDSKALEEAIRDFIFARQEEPEENYPARLSGKAAAEYQRQWILIDSYQDILNALLPNERHEIDALVSAFNGVTAIVAETEYRRGVMDAFHILRNLLNADDRRRASC